MRQELSLSGYAKQAVMKGFPPKLGAGAVAWGRALASFPHKILFPQSWGWRLSAGGAIIKVGGLREAYLVSNSPEQASS